MSEALGAVDSVCTLLLSTHDALCSDSRAVRAGRWGGPSMREAWDAIS